MDGFKRLTMSRYEYSTDAFSVGEVLHLLINGKLLIEDLKQNVSDYANVAI